METVDLADPEVGRGGGRRRRSLLAGIGATLAVAVGTVAWVQIGGDGDRAPEVATVDPTLAGATSATLDESSARVVLRSEDGDGAETVGVMTFGRDGRGVFEFTPVSRGDGPEHEIILDGGALRAFPEATYARFGTEWIRYSNEDFALDNGIRFPPDQNPVLAMIELIIDALDHAAPGTVHQVGTDVSHGDAVTVFEADVDIGDAIRSSSEVVDEDAADGLLDDIGTDATVWLDQHGRARLVRIDGGSVMLELELWDFGTPVDVEVPTDAVDAADVGGPNG